MDLGTGDGAAVLRLARQDPRALVLGVDTNASALMRASRDAAPAIKKGGAPNAVFLVGEAVATLALLAGRVDQLTITLPWGSLLRHVLRGEREFALAVAGAL